jgi:hypothetical protein
LLREADLRGALDTAARKHATAAPAANPPAGDDPGDEASSIDPTLIGTAKDYQLAKALAEVHALQEQPLARTQSSAGSR